ncbi:MAG: IclR family transcriptional regulator [Chthoniobacterales bacterium]
MSIPVVEKTFAVLEYLASTGRSASLQEVTQAARLPKPTTYRLLRSLQGLGYVERPSGSRNYLMGPRVSKLAVSDPNAMLKAATRPLLEQLNEEFNETVNLGVLSGQSVLYLEFIETTKALRYIAIPGKSDPYYSTALGRAITAGLTDKELDRLINKTTLIRQTSTSVRTKADLIRKISKTRLTGVAEEVEETVEGVSCFAINLKNVGFPQAAISIAIPVQRLTATRKTQILKRLKTLAKGTKGMA